jgi:hypothetical protein
MGQVGGEHFGVKVLADGFGRFASVLLDHQALLEAFESFLDRPAGMLQGGKIGGGVKAAVKQGGGGDLFIAVLERHPDEAERDRVGQAIHPGGVGGAPGVAANCPGDDLFAGAAVGESHDFRLLPAINTGHERSALVLQQGEQPHRRESHGPG